MKKVISILMLALGIAFNIQGAEIKTWDRIDKEYREGAVPFMSNNFTKDEDLKRLENMPLKSIPEEAQPQQITIPKENDNREVTVNIYRPKNSQNQNPPVIYYTHGGGFIMRLSLNYYQKYQNLADNVGAIVYVGDLDLFVNEDLAYASRLIEAGIPVELHLVRGLYHAFDAANSEGEKTKEFWQEVYNTSKEILTDNF